MPSTEKPNISYLSINLPVVIKNALEYNNKRKNPIMNTFFSRHTPTKKLNGIKVIKDILCDSNENSTSTFFTIK